MPDPNAVAAAARAWQEQGVNDGGATAGYGPLYDPETLRQQGVPPALVSAYEAAVRGYAQAQTQASDPTNFAAGSMVSQAGQRLRALEGQVTQYFKPAKADTYDPPPVNTSARYIPKQGANGQYDVGSSDYAGSAPVGWEANPNYKAAVNDAWDKYKFSGRNILGIDPTTGLPTVVGTLPDTSSGGASDGVGWANLAQRQKEFDQKMAWDRVKADMEREQADRTLQGQLYNHINNIWAQNLPRMGDPSQTYFAGAGPGGPLETLFKQGGSSYDPNQGKINWQNFDQNAAWKQAAGMVRR